jgi:phage gp16-like protein
MVDRALQRKIHVACRQLGLDGAARHDVQLAACGKASMRDMNDADLQLVISHLKERGFRPTSPNKTGRKFHKPAPRSDLRLVHVLWRLLGEAEVLEKPDRAGLNAFIRSQFESKWKSVPLDVDMLRDDKQINAVVRALKSWCKRAGIELKK